MHTAVLLKVLEEAEIVGERRSRLAKGAMTVGGKQVWAKNALCRYYSNKGYRCCAPSK
jgi:hypothetical protein